MKNKKLEYMDFVLNETKNSKTVFRFLPRESHCHGFHDDPPTCWSAVYKTYYAYQILKIFFNEEDEDEIEEIVEIYNEGCDECSIINEVAERCKLIAEGKEEVTITYENIFHEETTKTIKLLDNEMCPEGNGTCWNIRTSKYARIDTNEPLYEISLFDDFSNKGCRFWLTKNELAVFGKYLTDCCEYMLQHSEGI